jgi:FixJ family two-component response regulator
MSHATPIVFVVDDDVSVRRSLELLIGSAGWQPETFASTQEFLSCPRVLAPSGLVLKGCRTESRSSGWRRLFRNPSPLNETMPSSI